MPELQAEIVTDFAALAPLACHWQQLWAAAPDGEVFGTLAWARAWWRAYGEEHRLRTAVVREGGKVVGILPLAAQGRRLKFLGSPRSDYNDFLCRPDADSRVLEAALAAVFDHCTAWDQGLLENVPDHSRLLARLDSIAPAVRAQVHVSRASVHSRMTWTPDDRAPLLSAINKKHLRRKEAALRRQGELSFRHLETRDEIRSHLDAFFQMHIARRQAAGEASMFLGSRDRDFYRCLADEFDPRQELRFSVLELDGRPIGYHLGFEVNGKFVAYKPVFDPELGRCSPGEVLFKRMFEYAATRDLRAFDFTVGQEAFKARFANVSGYNFDVHLFPRGLRGRVRRGCYQAKDGLKRYPRLYRFVRRVAGLDRGEPAAPNAPPQPAEAEQG